MQNPMSTINFFISTLDAHAHFSPGIFFRSSIYSNPRFTRYINAYSHSQAPSVSFWAPFSGYIAQ